MHSVQPGNSGFADSLGCLYIRRDHAFFDDLVRNQTLDDVDITHPAAIV